MKFLIVVGILQPLRLLTTLILSEEEFTDVVDKMCLCLS